MVDLAISVITDEFSEEFDEVCEFLHGLGIKYVELRNVWLGNIIEIDDITVNDAIDVLKDNDLKVSALATPLLKCIPPSINPQPTKKNNYTENWQYNFSKIERALELSQKFEAKYIRVFGFQGKWEVKPINEWDHWEIFRDWAKALTEMKKKIEPYEKVLVCENESGLMSSLQQIEKIAKEFTDKNFGILFDTANTVNKHKEKGILTEEWLDKLAPYIKYIHAKGCKKKMGHYVTTYVNDKGDVNDWNMILNKFKKMSSDDFIGGLQGPLFISIETHMGKKEKWEKSKKSLQNLMELFETV